MLLEEIYLLTKHGRFTYSDVEKMPVYKRRFFLNRMKEEFDDIKKHQDKINRQSNSKNRG